MRSLYLLPLFSLNPPAQRLVVKMSATTTRNAGTSAVSMPVKLSAHPTYNLKSVIQLAQSEDAGDLGDMTCKTTIPVEMEVEAHFLAKEDGIVAGNALADMVFDEVDPSLKVEWYRKDGDNVHKGLQFGKVHGHGRCCTPCIHFRDSENCSGLRLMDKWAAFGTVTLETVNKIGQSGVTYISSGALTHSVKALDISLKIDTELALEVGKRTKRA